MKIPRTVALVALSAVLAVPSAFAQGNSNAKGKAKGHDKENDQEESRRETSEQMRFRGMDTDNDGVITRSEWRGNDQSFRVQDSNRDGVLSGEEVRRSDAATTRRDRTRREEQAARFQRADRNGDSRVARDEWAGNTDAFNRMDRNRDGVITRDEFSAIVADRAAGTTGAAVRRDATRAYQVGYDRGMLEGRQAGREDKNVNGGTWDLEGQRELEQADSGYNIDFGTRTDYQSGYRAGFRLGYTEGFGARR